MKRLEFKASPSVSRIQFLKGFGPSDVAQELGFQCRISPVNCPVGNKGILVIQTKSRDSSKTRAACKNC